MNFFKGSYDNLWWRVNSTYARSAILQPATGTSDLVSQTFCFVLYHIWPLVCSLFRFLFPIFVESLREEQCLRFCSPNFHANSKRHLWDPLLRSSVPLLQELFAWRKPWRHAARRACFAWKKPAVGVIALRGDVTLISRFFHLPSKRLTAFSKEMISKDSKVFLSLQQKYGSWQQNRDLSGTVILTRQLCVRFVVWHALPCASRGWPPNLLWAIRGLPGRNISAQDVSTRLSTPTLRLVAHLFPERKWRNRRLGLKMSGLVSRLS